ncbi:uncharacterized protein LOC130935062 [Arachis stenosperma]|uniref:uncharacterized protein LOC130935062 n=1 Tax=Arachis stenosperma TaxID=217475 RepID=UPI0025AD35B4|nr:uncharacterized protein LOC130935062 [Arachis stenosperma]
MWINSAEELWKELKHRYSHGDVYRIAELEEELFATKQGDALVTAYYTKLKSIWEELENFRPIPNCSRCVEKCNCEVNIMRGYKEESRTVRLLRGLNEQFSIVRSQIMLMEPLPTVDVAFASLLQQERQLNLNEVMEEKALLINSRNENSSTNTRGRGRGRGGRGYGNNAKNGRGSKQCSHCGKHGHLADTCYKKHGFPPHFKNNGAMINNMVAEDDNEVSNQSQKEELGKSEPYFTLEQKEALLALLNQ